MDRAQTSSVTKVVAVSAVAELATGMALALLPGQVITLLLDPVTSDSVIPVARIAGIALVALGLACWPGRHGSTDAAHRALLVYNLLVAAYLAASAGSLDGVLLWPAVASHAAIAGLLLYFKIAPRPG